MLSNCTYDSQHLAIEFVRLNLVGRMTFEKNVSRYNLLSVKTLGMFSRILILAMFYAARRTAALAWYRIACLLHNINFALINFHVKFLQQFPTWLNIDRICVQNEYPC